MNQVLRTTGLLFSTALLCGTARGSDNEQPPVSRRHFTISELITNIATDHDGEFSSYVEKRVLKQLSDTQLEKLKNKLEQALETSICARQSYNKWLDFKLFPFGAALVACSAKALQYHFLGLRAEEDGASAKTTGWFGKDRASTQVKVIGRLAENWVAGAAVAGLGGLFVLVAHAIQDDFARTKNSRISGVLEAIEKEQKERAEEEITWQQEDRHAAYPVAQPIVCPIEPSYA